MPKVIASRRPPRIAPATRFSVAFGIDCDEPSGGWARRLRRLDFVDMMLHPSNAHARRRPPKPAEERRDRLLALAVHRVLRGTMSLPPRQPPAAIVSKLTS